MSGTSELKILAASAASLGSMAAIVLTTIAVITGFKNTGQVANATADLFIVGVGIFAAFVGVIVLAIIGRTVVKLFKS